MKELKMAAAGKGASPVDQAEEVGPDRDLEADIRQLRADIAKLTEQLATTGEHSYSTARRAAKEGVEQLRAQGEAAMEGLRSNARDVEEQVLATVREKPITSLAVAAGIGYLLALLSRR
jgi:ElaB/YqjD/DUF883 family membrane-anchored ribosome-binding protein